MNPRGDFDDQLRAWAELGDERLPARYLDAALAQVETKPQRGAGWWPLKELIMQRKTVAALAFLGVAALVVGLALGRLSPQVTDRPSATLPPSPSAIPSPSPFGKAAMWSPKRAQLDWPVPVRVEPSGEPMLTTLAPAASPFEDVNLDAPWFSDPSGDLGASAPGWLDITKVRVLFQDFDDSGVPLFERPWAVDIELASPAPSAFPHPRERWVAYGLVVDVDDDGQPDLRLGMDNADARSGNHRAWWTDLNAGVTASHACCRVGKQFLDTWLPGESKGFGSMHFDSDDVGAFRFYVWASLIEDGRVVANDYAPDVGWVDGIPND
jgi:hypothetical protein